MKLILFILSLFLFSCGSNPKAPPPTESHMIFLRGKIQDLNDCGSIEGCRFKRTKVRYNKDESYILIQVTSQLGANDIAHKTYHNALIDIHKKYASQYDALIQVYQMEEQMESKWVDGKYIAPKTNTYSKKSDTTTPKRKTDREIVSELKSQDCIQYISLFSAKNLAKEFGWTESEVLQKHRINLWGKTTPNGKFPKVGEMYPGSNAIVIDRNGDDFKVISPLDNSIGWVNRVQVQRTLYLNPNTKERCRD